MLQGLLRAFSRLNNPSTLIWEVLQPSGHCHVLPLDALEPHLCPSAGTSELNTFLQSGSHDSELEKNPLPLPASHTAFVAARDALGFWAARAHCQFRFSSTNTLSPLQSCSSSQIAPVYPCVGLPQLRCRTSQFLIGLREVHVVPISEACWGPTGWHPLPVEYQTQHSPWCHLQVCWGCTQSHCLCPQPRCSITWSWDRPPDRPYS